MSGRPPADLMARDLIQADRTSDAAVRAIANRIPLAQVVDVLIALAAYANRSPAPLMRRERIPHDPNRRVPDEWTVEEARRAHAAYGREHRDAWTVAGERHYQRERARASRRAA